MNKLLLAVAILSCMGGMTSGALPPTSNAIVNNDGGRDAAHLDYSKFDSHHLGMSAPGSKTVSPISNAIISGVPTPTASSSNAIISGVATPTTSGKTVPAISETVSNAILTGVPTPTNSGKTVSPISNAILTGVPTPTGASSSSSGCCTLQHANAYTWSEPIPHDECKKIATTGEASAGVSEFASQQDKAALAKIGNHVTARMGRMAKILPGAMNPGILPGVEMNQGHQSNLAGVDTPKVLHARLGSTAGRNLRATATMTSLTTPNNQASDVNGVLGTNGQASDMNGVRDPATTVKFNPEATKMKFDPEATKMKFDPEAETMGLDLPTDTYSAGVQDGEHGFSWKPSNDETCSAAATVQTSLLPGVGSPGDISMMPGLPLLADPAQ